MKQTSTTETINGYLRGLSDDYLFSKGYREILADAPSHLSKRGATWAAGVSSERRRRREHGTVKTAPSIPNLPDNVKNRLMETINEEVKKIVAEVESYKESWLKILS